MSEQENELRSAQEALLIASVLCAKGARGAGEGGRGRGAGGERVCPGHPHSDPGLKGQEEGPGSWGAGSGGGCVIFMCVP